MLPASPLSAVPSVPATGLDAATVLDVSLQAASTGTAAPREVRSIFPAELGVSNPSSISYSPTDGAFVVVSDDAALDVALVTTTEEVVGSFSLESATLDATLAAFDPVKDRLVVIDPVNEEFLAVEGDATRDDSGSSKKGNANGLRLGTPRGATFGADGTMFVLDERGRRIVAIDPSVSSDQVADLTGGSTTTIRLRGGVPRGDLYGLALNPNTQHFFMFSNDGADLVEVDETGRLVATHDMAAIGFVEPLSMTFAPSADRTDSVGEQSLFIVDAQATVGEPESTRIAEVTFTAAAVAAATTETSTLIQTIDTSQFSPPSPDPAGLVYVVADDRMLMTDSEVNEMPIFQGVNLFEVTRTGAVTDTGVTTSYTNEPTGITLNPTNGHLYVTDDDAKDVTVHTAGPDGRHGTGDDVFVSKFDTDVYGNTDPEGITLDTLRNELVIVDGANREVYRVAPGPNGLFDGVDDTVTNFDTLVHGGHDPEGIHYNAATDTLLVVERGPDLVMELSPTGTLLRLLDISAAAGNPRAAGITLAPSTSGPHALSMFIVDRGVDNNSDPNENDGALYEMSFPPLGGNQPPIVDAGPDQSVTSSLSVTLDATVSDDGQPAPPGVVTTTWSQESGPAGVVFGDASAVDTSATFPGPGVYVLRLTADDSEFTSFDELTVSVGVIDIRIDAGSDDAEERQNTGMSVTSSDLEMTFDVGGDQTIGLRFNNVAVPPNATIVSAWLQFTVDEAHSGPTTLTVQGQASDNPATFQTINGNITSRPFTTAAVPWVPPAWNVIGEAGPAQRTPDISSVVQEIVSRPGWAQGNSLALFVSGTGERVAESFNGKPASAPLLHLEVSTTPPPNDPPDAVDDVVVTPEDVAATFGVTGNDSDPNGNLDPATTNTACATCSLPTDGGLVNNGGGSFTYTPDLNFTGPDSFVYE
ncbi:MAG: Ig-like domain-containing protein, partial [Acidimicrobiales bacterium]